MRLASLRHVLTFLVLMANTPHAESQVTEAWSARYDGPGHSTDTPTGILVDDSGNVYVGGTSKTAGFGSEDFTLIKYSPSGDTIWIGRLNGTGGGSDYAYAITSDPDGNIILTGKSWGVGTAYDILTVKYDPAGDTVWTRRYNGPRSGGDIAHALAVDAWGNVYVTGESEGSTGTHGIFEDYVTLRYSPEGDLDWVARYNGPAGDYDRSNAVAVDGSASVYVTGTSDGGSSGSSGTHFDYATIKYDSLGHLQWTKRFNGGDNADDEATDVSVDDFGNVYVTGFAHYELTGSDYVTIKYNGAGDSLWMGWYNGPADNTDEAVALAVDEAGNVYVTGRSYGGATTDFDYATICYTALGDTTWVRRYDGDGEADEATCLALDTGGNICVSGGSNGTVTGMDFLTLTYSPGGEMLWSITYANDGAAGSEDIPGAVTVGDDHSVYVTGMSALDFATIKYVPSTTGIRNGSENLPTLARLDQNYPNPFNPATTISYRLSVSSHVEISLYDIIGRHIATLVNETKSPGTHEITWDATGQASGVYYYRLATGNFTETKKLVLMR